MFLHMHIGKIYRIQDLIHTWPVGVPQYHQAHECSKYVVHHMELFEEQGVIDEDIYPPMKIIIGP